jgi:dTDP-4-dehydrorhamnose 3,5-epimerase-like enzyme
MSLGEVRLIELPHVPDERGVLTSIESGRDIPFEIRRVFFMHELRAERGGHAHRVTRQLVVPLAGKFKVDLCDGCESRSYCLDDRNRGLYLPSMTWARLYEFSRSAICLVVADTHYDDKSYIRDWDDFLKLVSQGRLQS